MPQARVPEFQATLLREKFTIRDPRQDSTDSPVIALSNRMVVSLPTRRKEDPPETLVVRTQNMHSCVRMAARLVSAAEEDSCPLTQRVPPFEWNRAWKSVIEGYEDKYNPRIWCAIYHEGLPVFEQGERHAFLDVIETCDFKTRTKYSEAVIVAENAFKKAGREVTIEHDSGTALVLHVTPEQGRVGAILRGINQTATFNFTARSLRKKPVKIPACMTVAAAFLEGIQLAFQVGMGLTKLRYGILPGGTDDAKRFEEGEKRMARLKIAILQFEQTVDMTYRPERPDFFDILDKSKQEARKSLKPQIEEMIRQGQIDGKDWVM